MVSCCRRARSSSSTSGAFITTKQNSPIPMPLILIIIKTACCWLRSTPTLLITITETIMAMVRSHPSLIPDLTNAMKAMADDCALAFTWQIGTCFTPFLRCCGRSTSRKRRIQRPDRQLSLIPAWPQGIEKVSQLVRTSSPLNSQRDRRRDARRS